MLFESSRELNGLVMVALECRREEEVEEIDEKRFMKEERAAIISSSSLSLILSCERKKRGNRHTISESGHVLHIRYCRSGSSDLTVMRLDFGES